jgi:hypothetical protein
VKARVGEWKVREEKRCVCCVHGRTLNLGHRQGVHVLCYVCIVCVGWAGCNWRRGPFGHAADAYMTDGVIHPTTRAVFGTGQAFGVHLL